jgi:hypothetical protein
MSTLGGRQEPGLVMPFWSNIFRWGVFPPGESSKKVDEADLSNILWPALIRACYNWFFYFQVPSGYFYQCTLNFEYIIQGQWIFFLVNNEFSQHKKVSLEQKKQHASFFLFPRLTERDPELCDALPALELCYSISQCFLDEHQPPTMDRANLDSLISRLFTPGQTGRVRTVPRSWRWRAATSRHGTAVRRAAKESNPSSIFTTKTVSARLRWPWPSWVKGRTMSTWHVWKTRLLPLLRESAQQPPLLARTKTRQHCRQWRRMKKNWGRAN